MPLVAAYHRPQTIDEALTLLAQPHRVPLGGGTVINADRNPSSVEVVDLQGLGLSSISNSGGLTIGATATLFAVASNPSVPEWLQSVARAESPSTLRTLATIGGVVATASAESVLLAALLVSNAEVVFAGADAQPLPSVLASGVPEGAIVTAVMLSSDGEGAVASTARTPADVPIVAAVAHTSGALALTGVASTPQLVDPADVTAGLAPEGDFRGSPSYRLELARVLSARAKEALA